MDNINTRRESFNLAAGNALVKGSSVNYIEAAMLTLPLLLSSASKNGLPPLRPQNKWKLIKRSSQNN